ncbi:serine/threonine-protein kinase [Streptomyces thermolilacinus]
MPRLIDYGHGVGPNGGNSSVSSPLTTDDPQRVGDYWLAARLGAGGQGVVYEAYDASGARHALKTLHREADPFLRDRFQREAEAARRVAAFCTARIVASGVDGDIPYLVTEYVPGPTLAQRVRSGGPLDEAALLRLATGAATALAAIHQADVVHRDLKPANVLLGPDGPRIIDFGIARAPEMSLTATGAMMGTFGYMAPEVLAGQRATAASDVFAWAAVVLYAATGKEPFRGENIAEVVHRTATVEPDLSGLPARIRPLLAAALAKDPRRRPAAGDLLLGLIGAPVQAADPRRALLEAGVRQATHAEPEPKPVPQPPSAAPQAAPDAHPDADADTATRAAPADGPAVRTLAEAPLGERAEAAFTALAPVAQLAAHALLLRLTVPGDAADGSQDAVRTATPAELYGDRPQGERTAVVEAARALTAAGALLTDDDGSVRPLSAALLPAWRRLRDWVDADRARLAALQRLAAAARRWEAHGRRTEDLLRGSELRDALDRLLEAPAHLRPTPLEQAFLRASRREAERAGRRRRRLLAALAAVTALAVLAGGAAWLQTQEAERRQAQATARAVAQTSENLRGTEPVTAMLLGLAAFRVADVPEARAALHAAATQQERAVITLPHLNTGDSVGRQLSADGRRLLSYSPAGAEVRDTGSGTAGARRPLASLPRDAVTVGPNHLPVLSPDGRLLLVHGKDGAPRLYRADDGKPFGPPVRDISATRWYGISDTGRLAFGMGTARTVVVTDSSGRRLMTATADTAHLSPDGTHLATCTAGFLSVRPVRQGAAPVISDTLPRVDDGPRRCPTVRFSPDGTRMAVASGPTGRHYDLRTGRTTGSFSGRSDFRFSSQGRFLVAWSDGAVEILTSGEARLLARIPTADADAVSVDVVLDEREKAVRHVAYGSDRFYEIDVTEVLDGRPEGTGVATEALSPDGDTAVVRTGHENPSLRVLDLASGKTVGDAVTQRTVPGPNYEYAAAVSDTGRVLAYADGTTGPDGTPRRGVTVRDLRAGREVLRVPVTNLEAVWRMAVSPDGRHLSVTLTDAGSSRSGADRYTTHVWDVQRRREIHRFDTPAGHGVFTPDSRRLLTTTGQELDLADGATRDGLFGTAPNTELAVSPDGRTVAVLKPSGLVELWDGAVRRRLGLMPSGLVRGGERHGDYVRGLRFSYDGGTLAALLAEETSRGGGDSVQLWDVAARVPLGRPLLLSGRAVDAVSFGGTVLRTVVGGTVQRLDLDGEALAERVCRRAGRDLTKDEWATYVPDLPRRDLCADLPDSTPAPGTAQAAAPPGRHPAVPR